MIDYYGIGQRIKRIRKARGLSQEQLAEQVDISTTHMSHIENANTKLSLAVFVGIAEALEVSADTLLYDSSKASVEYAINAVNAIMASCDPRQACIIAEIVRTAKQSMDVYL